MRQKIHMHIQSVSPVGAYTLFFWQLLVWNGQGELDVMRKQKFLQNAMLRALVLHLLHSSLSLCSFFSISRYIIPPTQKAFAWLLNRRWRECLHHLEEEINKPFLSFSKPLPPSALGQFKTTLEMLLQHLAKLNHDSFTFTAVSWGNFIFKCVQP